ncbi:hypothetical protein BGZ76_010566 [Entomortierella beljakovae]|nr:hypothetical protein BGZ76_010566 [Entomortierella beljakovae]
MSYAVDPHPCFFYGSLMDSRVLNSVTRPGPESNLHSVRATIEGYIRYPYHDAPYPGMIASDDNTHIVEGMLFFGHSLMDRTRLDQFEGSEYTRKVLQVKVLDPVPASFNIQGQQKPLVPGDLVPSYVYIFTGPLDHLITTREWDFDTFRRDHVKQWMETGEDFNP